MAIAKLFKLNKTQGAMTSEMSKNESGALIDGRNRLAACRRAGVEPHYTVLGDIDPVTYILSKNVARRNLTKGQKVLAEVLIKSQLSLGLQRGDRTRIANSHESSTEWVRRAAEVSDHDDLADSVMSGVMPLNQVYEEAKRRKERAESAESRLATLPICLLYTESVTPARSARAETSLPTTRKRNKTGLPARCDRARVRLPLHRVPRGPG
jgi:hypothetical protein